MEKDKARNGSLGDLGFQVEKSKGKIVWRNQGHGSCLQLHLCGQELTASSRKFGQLQELLSKIKISYTWRVKKEANESNERGREF